MKAHVSMTKVNTLAGKIWAAGFADVKKIIYYDAQYYNAGVYGWNCDVYVDPYTDAAITTGYRNMRGEMIPYDFIVKYQTAVNKLEQAQWDDPDYRAKRLALTRQFWDELATLKA